MLPYNALLHRRHAVPVQSIVLLLRRQARHANLDGTLRYRPRPGRGKMDLGFESEKGTAIFFGVVKDECPACRDSSMRYKLGRFLQLLGLVILPASIAGNLAGTFSLGESLLMAGGGVVVFLLGWLIQGKGP